MKKLLAIMFIPLFFAVSCKKVEDDTTPSTTSSYKTLTTYMVANDMDLPNIISDWIVAPPALADVQTFIDTYDIIDIRLDTSVLLYHRL